MKLLKSLSLSMMLASLTLCACSNANKTNSEEKEETQNITHSVLTTYNQDNESLTFNETAWNYDENNDVYWQIGVSYASNPETLEYETMGIYVPGAYMTGVENEDGTYTCTINDEGEVNGYTAQTAPIVFPINTAGYSPQASPTSYSYNGMSDYLEAGFIYVYSGMRGKSNGYDENGNLTYSGGAPWGVTDLKAAIRYYRFNEELLPGDSDRIFTLGHSGGGAQSSLMGATGDSELYYEYLVSIGAAMFDRDGNYISDAITGAMAWCPITSLDYADAAYEWNMGQYSSTGTRSDETWTSALSDDLAIAYASYINELGLTDDNGEVLTLEESEDGIYTSGSYYDYLLSVIEQSLNNFINDTTFPYTETASVSKGDAGFSADGELPDKELSDKDEFSIKEGAKGEFSGEDSTGTVYQTIQDYIDSLNSDEVWVEYDEEYNTVSITSIEAFINHCKNASKDVGAFDDLNRTQAENGLFGNDEYDSLHFDTVLMALLQQNEEKYSTYDSWDNSIIDEYSSDLTELDVLGNDSLYRQNMYNPMYFISSYYEGYRTSNIAPYWRINSGIAQGDTALTVEVNLALALQQCDDVEDVKFETVWGQGHVPAERVGDSTTNFIQWVNDCLKE